MFGILNFFPYVRHISWHCEVHESVDFFMPSIRLPVSIIVLRSQLFSFSRQNREVASEKRRKFFFNFPRNLFVHSLLIFLQFFAFFHLFQHAAHFLLLLYLVQQAPDHGDN